MIRCSNCGSQFDENLKVCPHCKTSIQKDLMNADEVNEQLRKDVNVKEITNALVMAIIGDLCIVVNFLGVPFVHIVGLVLGIMGLKFSSKAKKVNNQAMVAYVLSIIAIIGFCAAFVIGMITGALAALSQF